MLIIHVICALLTVVKAFVLEDSVAPIVQNAMIVYFLQTKINVLLQNNVQTLQLVYFNIFLKLQILLNFIW